MEIFRGKLRNFCSRLRIRKHRCFFMHAITYVTYNIGEISEIFLGVYTFRGNSPKFRAIQATNKTFKFVCTRIISDISPKFLPVLSYIFFIACRLYCSFIKLCYPELPIPKISTLLIQLSKEGVNLIFKKGRTLRQFLFNGEPKKSARKKNVCYRVRCLNCHYSYIGETSQYQWWDE